MKIPIYKPSLGQEEKDNVIKCLDTNWISSRGKFVEQFEKEFCEMNEVNFAATVSNGTVALHVALLALGIGHDDEVIVPTLTYIASANAIKYCGAKPVFADSRMTDWQIDPACIEEKITPKTKAIMVVHLYGHPCDMTVIMKIAKKYKLFVIEDCAEALGSKHAGQYTGTFGDISTFSFFGNKTITTGEGGMVVTNNETLHERVLRLKGQGLSKNRQYWHDIVGYNYRMTNICAAIGVAQMKKAKQFIDRKRKIADFYRENLHTKFEFHDQRGNNFHTYWMCSILLQNICHHKEITSENTCNRRVLKHAQFFTPFIQCQCTARSMKVTPLLKILAGEELTYLAFLI
jgi:perosamine synthetase